MDWFPGLTIIKDPQASKDWRFDWSSWLSSGEVIATHTIEATGITVDTDTNDATSVTVWLSGGTEGSVASVTCRITTDSTPARTDDRTVDFLISSQ